nr:PREDICTED: uncharacterized protein LOC109038423 [Bemisia tabaci]
MKYCILMVVLTLPITMCQLSQAPPKPPFDPNRDSFPALLRSKSFVDKSAFVNLFFESMEYSEYTMYVTAPRGFGKTSIMNMLKTFCQVQVDSDGTPLDRNSTSNRKLLSDYKLAIMKDEKFLFKYFGLYPVVHFRFDRLDVGRGYSDFIKSFQEVLSEAYLEHSYLADSSRLDAYQKSDYTRVAAKNESGWLTQRGKDLTHLLHSHLDRRSIVLVDDFDAPLRQMLGDRRLAADDVEKIHDFLKGFVVNLVKVNFFHHKSLITASARLIPPDVNSRVTEANSLLTVNFAENPKIAACYGFTEGDVLELAGRYGKEAEMPQIREWYGGYPIQDSNMTLYNMISILKYFETGELQTHWKDAGQVQQLLRPFFAEGLLKTDIEGSLTTNNTKMRVVDGPYSFNSRNIRILKNALENPNKAEKNVYVKNLLLKYLLDHGYFHVKEKVVFKGYIETVIPTYEVRKRLVQYLDENSDQKSAEEKQWWFI